MTRSRAVLLEVGRELRGSLHVSDRDRGLDGVRMNAMDAWLTEAHAVDDLQCASTVIECDPIVAKRQLDQPQRDQQVDGLLLTPVHFLDGMHTLGVALMGLHEREDRVREPEDGLILRVM